MRALSAPVLSALAGSSVGLAQLVELDLDIPWFTNTTGTDLVWNGNTYLGMAGVGSIDVIEDTPLEIKGLRFSLPAIVDSELATALIGMPQGRSARVLTAVFDPATFQILDAVVEWAGRLDVPQIEERGSSSVISVSAESMAVDLLRPSGLLYTNADQQRLHPGDDSFEFVLDQAEKSIVWPAARFFRKK